jgi:hypothetical protein
MLSHHGIYSWNPCQEIVISVGGKLGSMFTYHRYLLRMPPLFHQKTSSAVHHANVAGPISRIGRGRHNESWNA